MKEKILQFARGNFESAQASIQLSETNLIIQVEEGREQKGSFYIGNAGGVPMEGILYSECPFMHLKQTNFCGDAVSIEYTFLAERLLSGETVQGNIYIVTNCGEVTLPFSATVVLPTISYHGGRISDLTGFATVASEFPQEAVQIFKSEEFINVFLHRDIDNQVIYKSLIKSTDMRLAMEEFLIASRKKNRINITVDKNNLFYSNCRARTFDKVTITRSTWGCIDIDIYSNVKFIVPKHNKIQTEEFTSDNIDITFEIIPELMHDGKNNGSITIKTIHQIIEINIECIKHPQVEHEVNITKSIISKIMRKYIHFRNNEIKADQYVTDMETILDDYREKCSSLTYASWKTHIAMVDGQIDSADEYVKQLRFAGKPSDKADIEEIIEYSAACYVAALSATGEIKEKLIDKAVNEIQYYYRNGYECWQILWFLLNIDARYQNDRIAFDEILRYIEEGCYSPVMYLEFCMIVKRNPDYIHDWHDCIIRPIAWGIREKLFDREMALTFTYYFGRVRKFSEIAYLSLCRLYEQFELEDTLQALCVMLIKADKTASSYFKWYELGVEKQLRITQIYEYYMHSLGDINDKILPHQVLMYFMYDNHLSQKEKAVLYAAAVRGKDINPSAYRAYTLIIYNFTRRQLDEGNISPNLALLYEDSLKLNEIDETIARALPEVMFKHEIICSNSHMRGVYIVHNELYEEVYVPFVNGKAMIDIYSDKAYIFLVDDNGNRYLENQYYTLHKLLKLDDYADKCFEIVQDSNKLLAYMFGKCEKDYRVNQTTIMVRRYVNDNLRLRDYYRRRNEAVLIQYYYEHAEGEYLDKMLKSADLSDAERDNCSKWTELLMVRGMMREALNACKRFGYNNIDSRRLSKFCDEIIAKGTFAEENEDILKIAYYVYENGDYSESILGFLADFYCGSTDKMLQLWSTLGGFEISRCGFEERLLEQMAFSEYDSKQVIPVIESYLDVKGNRNLKKAVIAYLAYRYLLYDEDLTERIWKWVREILSIEDNTVYTLAILKWYSNRELLNSDETEFCDIKLTLLLQKGILMPYYKQFAGKLQLPEDIVDRVIVSCIARPGINMMLKYIVDNNKAVTSKVNEVFYGIYVKSLVVFEGETVSYEFFEDKEFNKNVLQTGSLKYSSTKTDDQTRFGMINKMIKCTKDENVEELYTAMSSYIKLEETSKHLFSIL